MKRTKQNTDCDVTVRHASYTVPGCGFVAKYQNTSNLENHYVTTEAGKQHDTLKKNTMDKTLENTLKIGMNTILRLVITKESSPMMKARSENGSRLRWVGGW
jgi:hypothetical protein